MKKGIQKVLVMLLALSMIFSTMAMPTFADDNGNGADKIEYTGETVSFIKADGSAFGMLTAQDGTTIEMQGDNVVIHYVPKKKTTYAGFNWGSIEDPMYLNETAPDPEIKPNEDGTYDITLSKDHCGYAYPIAVVKASWNPEKPTWTSEEQYYLAIPAEETIPVACALEITNTTGMFKVVTATAVENADGSIKLTFALSGTGYHWLYKGTYEEALSANDTIAAGIAAYEGSDNLIKGIEKAGKWTFQMEIGADELGKEVPVVAISGSYYDKYVAGQNTLERAYFPRQFKLDMDTKTLVTGDYADTKDLVVTNNVSMFTVSDAALETVGGPNSNNYANNLLLTMGSSSYDQMFVGRASEAEKADATIPLDENQMFSAKVMWIETAGQPDTIVTLIGDPFIASFHSKSKDKWYDRWVTVNAEKTNVQFDPVEYNADFTAVDAALATVPEDLSIYTSKTAQAVTAAVEAVDRCKFETEQDDVDAMEQAIKDAVAGLKEKINIAEAKVTGLSNQTYNGKAFTPAPVVTVDGEVLDPKTDYTVSYKNNMNAGTATVTITGNGDYTGETTATFTIEKAAQSITGPAAKITKTYGDAAFKLNAKTNGSGTLTYETSKTSVATVDSKGNVTIKGAGTATITIKAAETDNYKAATKTVTLTVNKKAQSVTGPATTITRTYGGKAFNLNAKASGGGKLTYKSSNDKVAAVSSAGKVTIKGAGSAKITISAAETANYKAGSKIVTVKVKKAANKMKASGKTATVSASKVKKGNQTVKKANAFNIKSNNGKLTFTKSSGKAKITVSKTGKITVKKGLAKGTYQVKVKVKAAGNKNYKAKTTTVTVTIKVK